MTCSVSSTSQVLAASGQMRTIAESRSFAVRLNSGVTMAPLSAGTRLSVPLKAVPFAWRPAYFAVPFFNADLLVIVSIR